MKKLFAIVCLCLISGLRVQAQYQKAYPVPTSGYRSEVSKVIPDFKGGHVIVGWYQDYDANNLVKDYISLTKLNADGTVGWAKRYECYSFAGTVRTTEPIKGLAVAQSPDPSDYGFVIVGTYVSGGNSKCFIMKTDAVGKYPSLGSNAWAYELVDVHDPAVAVGYDNNGDIVVFSRGDVRNHDFQLTWVDPTGSGVIKKIAYGTANDQESPVAMFINNDDIYLVGTSQASTGFKKIAVARVSNGSGFIQQATNIITQGEFDADLIPTDIECSEEEKGLVYISGYIPDGRGNIPVGLILDKSTLAVNDFIRWDFANVGNGYGKPTGIAINADYDYVAFSGAYDDVTGTGSMLLVTDYDLNPITNGLIDLSLPASSITEDYLSCITLFENNVPGGELFLAGVVKGRPLYGCRSDNTFAFECETHVPATMYDMNYSEDEMDEETDTYADLGPINIQDEDLVMEDIKACSMQKKESSGIPSYDIIDNKNILLYPNPSGETVMVDVSNVPDDEYALQIIDMTGHVVYNEKYLARGGTKSIDVSTLKNGIYSVVLCSSTRNIRAELIVTKP